MIEIIKKFIESDGIYPVRILTSSSIVLSETKPNDIFMNGNNIYSMSTPKILENVALMIECNVNFILQSHIRGFLLVDSINKKILTYKKHQEKQNITEFLNLSDTELFNMMKIT